MDEARVEALRERCLGAARGTLERDVAELIEDRDQLRDTLRLTARRHCNDGPCWCEDSPRREHERTCGEIRELLGE